MTNVFKGMKMRTLSRNSDTVVQVNKRYGIMRVLDKDIDVVFYSCERLTDEYVDVEQFKKAVNALTWLPVVTDKPYSFHQRVLQVKSDASFLRYMRWFVPENLHRKLVITYLADNYGPAAREYLNLRDRMLNKLAKGDVSWPKKM